MGLYLSFHSHFRQPSAVSLTLAFRSFQFSQTVCLFLFMLVLCSLDAQPFSRFCAASSIPLVTLFLPIVLVRLVFSTLLLLLSVLYRATVPRYCTVLCCAVNIVP